MQNEGWDLARALTAQGVAAFVLKYRSQLFADDCDEDHNAAYAEAHQEDYIDIIMTKLDKLAKAKGYPPYGDNSYEAETVADEAKDDETGDDPERHPTDPP